MNPSPGQRAKRMLRSLLGVALWALPLPLAACSLFRSGSENDALLAAQPPEIQQAIRRHDILPGMTPEQVWLSAGPTDCLLVTYWQDKIAEVWAYTYNTYTKRPSKTLNCRDIAIRVYFINGRVVEVRR